MHSRRGAGYREEAGRGRQLNHGQEELSRRSEAGEGSLLGTWWMSTRCPLSVLPVARLVRGREEVETQWAGNIFNVPLFSREGKGNRAEAKVG